MRLINNGAICAVKSKNSAVLIGSGRRRAGRSETMKNREKLLQQSMYDFLYMLNANLRAFNSTCVMIGLIGYDKHVIRCYEHKANCEKCLQSWMNEDPF